MGIREDMPMLARHEGVWDGSYVYYNYAGDKIDEHQSRLICRMMDDPAQPYSQTNYYTWADGKKEKREFPATYKDGRIWFDNELIKGWAAAVPLDEFDRTMMLYWQRQGDPELYLYEMIQLSDCGKNRCRTWHWIRSGKLETRTAIQETFVTKDWQSVEPEMKAAFAGV